MTVSQIDLHAYVDGELAQSERIRVTKEILACEELSGHIRDLQTIKRLIDEAYNLPPIPHEGSKGKKEC